MISRFPLRTLLLSALLALGGLLFSEETQAQDRLPGWAAPTPPTHSSSPPSSRQTLEEARRASDAMGGLARELNNWRSPSSSETAPVQPGEPGNGGAATNNGGPVPPGVPVDGGLGFLVAAGAAYAVRELRKRSSDDADDDMP